MGLMDRLEALANPQPKKSNRPRDLTPEDYAEWDAALNSRAESIHPRNLAEVRFAVKSKNPIRWMQLQRDLKWVGKELKKLGLNPEDARYIL